MWLSKLDLDLQIFLQSWQVRSSAFFLVMTLFNILVWLWTSFKWFIKKYSVVNPSLQNWQTNLLPSFLAICNFMQCILALWIRENVLLQSIQSTWPFPFRLSFFQISFSTALEFLFFLKVPEKKRPLDKWTLFLWLFIFSLIAKPFLQNLQKNLKSLSIDWTLIRQLFLLFGLLTPGWAMLMCLDHGPYSWVLPKGIALGHCSRALILGIAYGPCPWALIMGID